MMRKSGGRVRKVAAVVSLASLVFLAACGGDDDDGGDTGGDVANTEQSEDDGDDDSGSGIDNCSLLTDDEVSAFAGKTLVHGEDSVLGCGFAEPDASIADFSVLATRSGQSVADVAAELAPSLDVHDLMGGDFDEAVALFDGDEANFLIMRRGDVRVVLVMTFLDITTGQPLADATHLAETALDRAG